VSKNREITCKSLKNEGSEKSEGESRLYVGVSGGQKHSVLHPFKKTLSSRTGPTLEGTKKMTRAICFLILMALFFLLAGYEEDRRSIESISIDFPSGETRLVVWKDGTASLFYGALPQSEIIKSGTFNIEELYKQLQPRLHRNLPREDWPNPNSTRGMVQLKFKDKSEKDYLIFDEQDFAEKLFSKARKHIVAKGQ
jgi:hypothetical protein